MDSLDLSAHHEFLPQGWDLVTFDRCIVRQRYGGDKVKRQDYLRTGAYPVIDQGQKFIGGYWDDSASLYDGSLPVVVFGDHTRIFKYIDFRFVRGADGTKILLPDTSKFDPYFFYLACLHLVIPSKGYSRHYKLLKEQSLPLPPLFEQRRIAAALRTIQDAIAAQDDVIAAARELKRSLMRRLFTYGPGRDPAPTKETEIGEIPEHWEVVTLGEVIRENIKNGAFVRRERYGRGIPFLNVADTYKKVSVSSFGWERVDATDKEIEMYGIQSGDLYYVRSSLKREGVGHCCIVETVHQAEIFDCHLMRVRANETVVLPKYLAYYSLSQRGKAVLIARSKTTTMTTINQQGLRGSPMPFPAVPEQSEIVNVLEALDAKIAAEEQRKAALEELGRSTLEQLMTGQIRLPV